MSTSTVTSAEILRRRNRRRTIGIWIASGVMVLVIATVALLAVGFNNSWWVQANPTASTDQQAPDGSSTFTQPGIDYFTRKGVVDVTMSSTRPTAAQLGLDAGGTKHIDFLVPLKVDAVGTSTVSFALVDALDIVSSGDKLSALEITPSGSYEQLVGEVHTLAAQVGWSDSAVAKFDADLAASRQQSGGASFTATIGPAASTGMRISATLSGDQTDTASLVIRLEAAR